MKAGVQIAQVSSKLKLATKLTKMWRDIDFMEYTSHIEKGILSMLMQNCGKVESIVFGKHNYVKHPNGLAAVLSHLNYIETFKARQCRMLYDTFFLSHMPRLTRLDYLVALSYLQTYSSIW